MTDQSRPKIVDVYIDSVKYRHRSGPVTPAEIRRIAEPDIPVDKDIWLDVDDDLDRRLDESDTVDLVAGMHFFSEFPAITITIDREPYEIYERKMTGAQLRVVPSPDVAEDRDLWLDVPGARDRKIQDEDILVLKDGMRFFTAPGRINPGRVDEPRNGHGHDEVTR